MAAASTPSTASASEGRSEHHQPRARARRLICGWLSLRLAGVSRTCTDHSEVAHIADIAHTERCPDAHDEDAHARTVFRVPVSTSFWLKWFRFFEDYICSGGSLLGHGLARSAFGRRRRGAAAGPGARAPGPGAAPRRAVGILSCPLRLSSIKQRSSKLTWRSYLRCSARTPLSSRTIKWAT